MDYFFKILILLSFVFLAYHYIGYLSKSRSNPNYGRRKAGTYLFLGFMALIGISNIFADALFEFFNLEKPANFELISFAAYAIFAVAIVLLFKNKSDNNSSPPSGKTITQSHSGSGNNYGGDHVEGNKQEFKNQGSGDQNIYLNSEKKFERGKELTEIQKINPDNLVGRTEDLKNLRELLSEKKQIVVVNGMGGIGKTTLAEAYVFEQYDNYDHIAWITNKSETVLTDFVQNTSLLKNLELENTGLEPQPLFEGMLMKMKNFKSKKNLLIIDNAVKDAIAPFLSKLPSPPGWHLLITSREEIPGIHKKDLSFLNPEEARKLFIKYCKTIKDTELIDELTASVEYHTLTVEILAKTADQRRLKPEQLRAALKTDARSGGIETKRSGTEKIQQITTYLASIFDLSALNSQEIWLLKQFTCLPSDAHKYERLLDLINPNQEQSETFAEVLNNLTAKGWLLKSGDADKFKMHRIVGEVVKKINEVKIEDIRFLLESVTQKLSIDQTKDNPIHKFKWVPFGKTILDNFQKNEEKELSTLQNNLATVLQALGDYAGAKELLEKAMISAEKNFGEEHPTTAVSYSNLALVLKDLGDYAGAKELLEKAMISAEKNFGEEHPTTAVSYSNLALVLKALGDYAGAKELLEKAMISAEKNFGEEHPTTAVRYSNLATVLKALGDYAGAKELLEKAMISAEKNFGEEHPTTAVRYSNLATVLQALGDYAGAKELLEKAMISDEKNFGEEHPTTAVRYSNLALVLQALGDYAGAKELLEKAMISAEKNFGEEHPTTAVRYSNLATVLKALGDYAGAKELLEKAMISAEKNFGEEHPTTAVRYSNLATVLQALGDYAGAKELLEKAMISDEKNFGEEHPTTAVRYSNLALVLQALGDYAGAKELLEKAMISDEKNFGEEHPTTAVRYSNLALVLQALGDYAGAFKYSSKSVNVFENVLPSGHPNIKVVKQILESIKKSMKKN